MIARVTILIASLLATAPAMAQSMSPDQAQRFVAGKVFAFSCSEGTRGLGQVYRDGSVLGTIQSSGSGPVRSFGLPPGTLKVKGESMCASSASIARPARSAGAAILQTFQIGNDLPSLRFGQKAE